MRIDEMAIFSVTAIVLISLISSYVLGYMHGLHRWKDKLDE